MAGEKQRAHFNELVARAGLGDVGILLVEGRSHEAICAADAVLVASGTATLEVALFKKPMVIAYKVMAASWHVMRHMGYQPWIGLPNILAREFVVPELLHDAPNRLRLVQRFTDMHHSLLRNSAEESAAAVLRVIQASSSSRASL
jgi:lipid-A-disaccharide synthase